MEHGAVAQMSNQMREGEREEVITKQHRRQRASLHELRPAFVTVGIVFSLIKEALFKEKAA